MNAAIFRKHGGPEVIAIADMPNPRPGATQALIRVEAAALNHLDVWVRRGLPFDIALPHIGGCDIAGVVESLGTEAKSDWTGKRVVVDPSLSYGWYEEAALALGNAQPFQVLGEHVGGGFAEYVCVPVENLVEVPEHVPLHLAAAGALAGVTAWRGLIGRGGLVPGESVLITGGSGGVATMATQIARAAGAIIHVVTSGHENMERVSDLGADYAYDRTSPDWSKTLWQNTGKRGIQLCLDSVGPAMWPTLIRSMAVGGRLVCYGSTTGHESAIDLRYVFWKQLSILGSTMGSPSEFRRAMNLVFQGTVKPVIHCLLPLASAQEAHQLLEDGNVFGKVVLQP